MPAPLVGLAVGAAARAVAKKVATGAAKKAAAKGSGKLKYKNTVKEARLDTKKLSTDRIAGKKLTKSEATSRARKTPNLPKEIAKEDKIRTGVNTKKPATPKVPTKKTGKK
jgi:hypothetical protein